MAAAVGAMMLWGLSCAEVSVYAPWGRLPEVSFSTLGLGGRHWDELGHLGLGVDAWWVMQ